jgi:5,6-dimethylbenzimidazole synthase
MEFTTTEAETLRRILRWRRDVRHFQTKPVAQDIIDRLRLSMDCAPSVGNARPWRVILVTGTSLRASVRANFNHCNAQAAAHYDDDQQADYIRLKLAGLDTAPVQLVVFTVSDPAEGHGLGRRTHPETLRQSTAMAIHTLWLAARVENIGLGIVSILDPRAMEQLFAVPDGWEFAAYLCLGYPEFSDDTPLLHRAEWQENMPTVWEER